MKTQLCHQSSKQNIMKRFLLLSLSFLIYTSIYCQKNITIDFATEKGFIKDIFGGNRGADSTEAIPFLHEMGIKYIRTHDFHGAADYFYYSDFWNKDNNGNFTTINTSFDPANANHYHWTDTDNSIQHMIENDFVPYFRIGTSYPNPNFILEPMTPPSDAENDGLNFSKFSQLVLHTVKHYNSGWDNGFDYEIPYWEIWNEPGGQFWDGTAIQFFEMYKAISTTVKTQFPNLKIGAPGAVPTTTLGIQTIYREDFIGYCKEQNLDLDFYSWHAYGLENPYGLKQISANIRSILDANNFTDTESHLTEINANLGAGLSEFITTSKGAAYYLSMLLTAQESDIDMLLLYPSVAPVKPNLFIPGFNWTKSAYGLKAFALLKEETPIIVQTTGNEVVPEYNDGSLNFMVFAAKDEEESKLYAVVSNYQSDITAYHIELSNLPWAGEHGTIITKNIITDSETFTESNITLPVNANSFDITGMDSPSVLLLRMEADVTIDTDEQSLPTDIRIFPNPATDVLTIEGRGLQKVEILNMAGQKLKSAKAQSDAITIDISQKIGGLYLIKIMSESGIIFRKVVIE